MDDLIKTILAVVLSLMLLESLFAPVEKIIRAWRRY
jgi:hypothetical protein